MSTPTLLKLEILCKTQGIQYRIDGDTLTLFGGPIVIPGECNAPIPSNLPLVAMTIKTMGEK